MSRGAALLLGARLTSAITTLAVLSLVARLRGSDDLGLVAVGLASGAILATLSDPGLGSFLIREGARDEAETGMLLGALLLTRLMTVPLVLLGAWLVLHVAFGDASGVVWLVAAGLVFQQWAELSRQVFLSRQRVGLVAGHAITENLAWVTVIAVLLATGAPIVDAFIGGLAIFALSSVAGLVIAWAALGVRPRLPSVARARRLALEAAPFAMFGVLTTGYKRIDTILVGLLVPGAALAAAGNYFAAARLMGAFEYLPEALSRSLLPALSKRYAGGPARLVELLRPAASFLLFAGIPVPFAVVIVGQWLMELIVGAAVGPYGWILVGLATLTPFHFLGLLFGVTLTSADAQWRRVSATFLAFIAVAVIDILLLPRIGVAGALIGAAAATAVVVGLYAAEVRRLIGSLDLGGDALRSVTAASLALAVGLAARSALVDPAAAIVFAAVYLLLLAAMGRPLALARVALRRSPP